MNQKKIITIVLLTLTVVLGLIAVLTAFKIYQLDKKPVEKKATKTKIKEKKAEPKKPEVFQQTEYPCQLSFTVAAGSPSPSPSAGVSPSPSPSEKPSPSPSTEPSPSPSASISPSPSAGVSPSPSASITKPSQELPEAGTTLPTLIFGTLGIILIIVGLVL